MNDTDQLLKSFLRLHNSMIRALNNYDSAKLQRLLGIMEHGLLIALNLKDEKEPK